MTDEKVKPKFENGLRELHHGLWVLRDDAAEKHIRAAATKLIAMTEDLIIAIREASE